ncbi:uracil phosphoribosyltransferase [Coraliomargarita akajimensis]|uniref:Uracil phosphoribosyltransferase n=1 Tax=Coraliomargarita akajimensis (strain DSM 45221 / IAM 15411 / JCM 23193 / KCTC 12865 / 04OKA010-24) TaxID=583355 RepID=D5EI02_CORAD|nr:uracil phosphoribosyltransferase [Coraliomargarita akajimensis]ADE56042.1 uracil phosphoribosyltransferase [Coraliomargarita akajimensis DSM 45221]
MSVVTLEAHPLVRHYVSILRDRETATAAFRQAASAVTQALILEASQQFKLESWSIETPLERYEAKRLKGTIVLVPILRAGLGMLDSCLNLLPSASVGFIGMERDEATAEARSYYAKMPDFASAEHTLVIDPMLATGGSAAQTIDALKAQGATSISMLCIIAAPEGVEALQDAHPDVSIVAGCIDRELDEKKYIRPGLGDFGDRLYCT